MRPFTLFLALFSFILNLQAEPSFPDRKIWYNEPALYFESALPIGNGRIGATIFGQINNEKILLNESSFWSGGPVNANMNPEAYTHLPEIRKALFNEDYALADKLVKQLQGKFSESYLPLGNLYIDHNHSEEIENYRRELNLRTGVATVSYSINGDFFKREYFVSYPDQVLVIRLTTNSQKGLNFSIYADSQVQYSTKTDKDQLIMKGKAPVYVAPNYLTEKEPIIYDAGKGMKFESIFRVKAIGGKISDRKNKLNVNQVKEAIILVSIATSYNGLENEPGENGLNQSVISKKYLQAVDEKPYEYLVRDHTEDFSSLFNRVSLDLGGQNYQANPTDERLRNYTSGTIDHDLEALYFQFGRYLMISASRPGGIPANLQGIWNPHIRPPWSSNFTANINSEMNYWPAEITNLSELHEPLLEFIGRLRKTGEITARTFYNCKGWCCSHNTDLWAMTNPVGNFGQGHPVWANWSMAAPWYSTHLWEHYQFTLDTAYLRDYAYPIMKGAAEFCYDFLVEGPDNYLVTAPSTSPENEYINSEGYKGATLYGSTADMSMIREHFENSIKAGEILSEDSEFIAQLKSALDKMYPYQVGKKGNLQEWYYDWEDADPEHRHVSHLFGLFPGNQISVHYTPELAEACKRSLELRGDGGTGWSKAWKINLWARLLDGNHAYKMLQSHLNYVDPSPEIRMVGGGTYPNLWDAHPPFQIDGNFGGTSGMAEMLLQSHNNEIFLLPALPDAWKDGNVKGLRARGGFTIDIEWHDNTLTLATIVADYDSEVRIKYRDENKSYQVIAGQILTIE